MRHLLLESTNSQQEAQSLNQLPTQTSQAPAPQVESRLLILHLLNKHQSNSVFLARKRISEQNAINQIDGTLITGEPTFNENEVPFQSGGQMDQCVNNELRVLKFIDHRSRDGLKKLKNEADLRSELDHKDVFFVKSYGVNHCPHPLVFTDLKGETHQFLNGHTFSVYEHCEGGNLWDLVTQRKGTSECLSDQDSIRAIYNQIFKGIHFLHTKLNFVHQNLGLSQVHLDSEMRPKIGGLGYASQIDSFKLKHLHKHNKNQFYFAPEILNGTQQNGECEIDPKKIDIFALGVMLFTSLFKSPPFEKAKKTDALYKHLCSTNLSGKDSFFRTHPKTRRLKLDIDLMYLLLQMMHEDASKRPDLEQVMKNAWLNKQ